MQPWEHSRASRLAGPIGLAALTVAGVIALSSVGLLETTPRFLGPASVTLLLLNSGLIALAYLLGAWGLGRPLAAWLTPESASRRWLQLALGLGAMLWLSHLLGLLGLFSGPGLPPRIAAWALPAIGLVLLADQVIRGPLRPEKWPVLPVSAILWAPALAVLIVACANPPGMLWRQTEFGAFDALSYHLQLPKEWAAGAGDHGARLWPTDHNVYSYLPSFVEAAFLHIGAMMPGPSDPLQRMLGVDGNWVIACQFLHAGLAIIGSLLTARAAWSLARRCEVDPAAARVLAVIAGALVLATPWVLVVASLPYNDAGVIPFMAAGVLACVDGSRGQLGALGQAADSSPAHRSAWKPAATAGVLVGIACCCKPTALFMAGPIVGLLLMDMTPARRWLGAISVGAAAGLAAIAPWLIRNALGAGGNPVFPFAAGIFGRAHWTEEQIARHALAHHAPPGLGAVARLARLAGGEGGLTHAQWGITPAVLIIAALVALAWPRSRRLAAILTLGLLAQLTAWMTLTHLQSRFLLPIIVTAALLAALAGGALVHWVRRTARDRPALTWSALAVLALAPLSQSMRSLLLFLEQNGDRPNEMLVLGVGSITGMGAEPPNPDSQEFQDFLARLTPVQFVNLQIRPQETPDAGVYLLGDTTPLYFLGAVGDPRPRAHASPVVYATTWDTPPLATVSHAHNSPVPSAWSPFLRRHGVRYVLVNYDELARLIDRSHYFDPAITLETIAQWLSSPDSHVRSVRTWRRPDAPPHTGSELFEITLPRPASEGGTIHG